MAWDKREAIRRREEARQQTYNSFGEQETTRPVDSWERSSGATNSSAVRTQSDTTRNTQSYTATRNAQKLASDWLNATADYMRSGKLDTSTRDALNKQYNGIGNYLKTWGKDIGSSSMKEIQSALDQAYSMLNQKPNDGRLINLPNYNKDSTPTNMPGTNEKPTLVNMPYRNYQGYGNIGNALNNNITLKENAAINEYQDYLKEQEQYSPQRAREILHADPTRTSEYDKAAQLSEFINGGGSLDGLSESDKDKIEDILVRWSQNKVNKDYMGRVNSRQTTMPVYDDQTYNDIPIQEENLEPLRASNNQLLAASQTVTLNRQKEKIADMVANDPGTAMQYYSMYIHDMDKLGGSYKAQDITSTATYNEAVTYGYLKATQGEDAANRYWNALEGELMQRSAEKDIEYVADALGGSEFAHGVANLATQLGANANTIVGSFASPLTYLPGLGSNRQFTADMLQYQNAVKAQNAQEVAGDSKLARILWEGASSGIENVVEAAAAGKIADAIGLTAVDPSLIGKEGALAYDGLLAQEKAREDFISVFVTLGMSSGAAMTAVEEGKAKGYSADEAAIRGLISGAIEFMTEKVGMDGVFKAVGEGKGALMAILKSGLAEGAEELVGNNLDRLATAIADAVTKKDVSEYQQKVINYIQQGMSEAEAMQKVMLDYVDEDVEAFASAFFSAGMSAGGMGALTGNDIRARRAVDSIINNADARQNLVDIGLSSKQDTEAYKKASEIQNKIDSGENVNSTDYEELYYADARAARGVADTVTGKANADANEILKRQETEKAVEEARRRYVETYQQTVKNAENGLMNLMGESGQKFVSPAVANLTSRGLTPSEAYRAISDIYVAGTNNTAMPEAASLMSDNTARAIYRAGARDKAFSTYTEADIKIADQKSAGVVDNDALRSVTNKTTLNAIGDASELAQRLGNRVTYMASNDKYNGRLNTDNGEMVIYLDNAQNSVSVVLGHETMHWIKKTNEAGYSAFRNATSEALGKAQFNAQIKDQMEKFGLSREVAEEEVVCDYAGELFKSTDVLRNFVNSNRHTNEGRTRIRSLRDAVRHFISWAKGENSTRIQKISADMSKAEKILTQVLAETEEIVRNMPSITAEIKADVETVGVDVADGAVTKNSLKTWNATDIRKLTNSLIEAGFEAEEVEQWIRDVNSVANTIAENADRLDYIAAPNHKFLKANGDYYKKTLDASTLCAKRVLYQGTYDAIQHAMPNTPLTSDDVIRLRQLMKEMHHEVPCGICYVESQRKTLGKYAGEWLETYRAEYIPTLDQVTTTDGLEALRTEHPKTYDDFIKAMKAKGVQSPKVVELRTEYRQDVTKIKQSTIDYLNKIGGLRINSFSDFETPHIIDFMQAVMDMSSKGLKGMAYTKVPAFAWIFGGTGIKINLSLIPKTDSNGNIMRDKNGRAMFDDVEGMPIEEALRIRDAYPDNVATIVVGKDMNHVIEMMADDRVDYIIPFHHSKWSNAEFEQLGLKGFEDFATGHQDNQVYPSEYWDASKSGKENAERYLEICAERHVMPVFEQLLDEQEDGSYKLKEDGSTDGYWKLIIEGKMYNHLTGSGQTAEQHAVRPVFNMEKANETMRAYEGDPNTLPVAQDVVDRFVEEYKANHPRTKYSQKDSAYLDAVNKGDMETAQKMVDQAAKDAGYTEELFHGTKQQFTSFDINRSRFGNFGYGFYFGDEWKAAEYGGENKLRVYVNTSNLATDDDHRVTPRMFQSAATALNLDPKKTYMRYVDTASEYVNKRNDYRLLMDLETWAHSPQFYGKTNTGHTASEILSTLQNITGYNGLISPSQETVVWDNTLIKSADPVTYDDNGNIIPLSERFNEQNADIRYSRKDSDGKTLTAAQAEYFKDSKVRDDDGNLLVMYHGTNEDFTIFKADEWSREDTGDNQIKGYFSEDEEYSEIYGDVKSYYLNISNPLLIDRGGNAARTLDQWKQWLRKKGITGVKFDSGISKDGLKGGVFDDGRYYSFYELLAAGGPYWYEDGNLTGRIKAAGYDGIHYDYGEKAWMPFEANAIKSTDNQNPTENEDIRYSRKGLTPDYAAATEAAEQSNDIRLAMDVASEWRENVTTLDIRGLNKRSRNIIAEFGDAIEGKKADNITDRIDNLAKSIVANKNMSYDTIRRRTDSIASDILFKDTDTKKLMQTNSDAAILVDNLSNLILANIVNTDTKNAARAMRELQAQIERNERIKNTLRDVREKRDKRIAEDIERRKEKRAQKKVNDERTKAINLLKRAEKLRTTAWNRAVLDKTMGDYDTVARSITDRKLKDLGELKDYVLDRTDPRSENYDPDFIPTQATLETIARYDKPRIADMSDDQLHQYVLDLTRALQNIANAEDNAKVLIDTQYGRENYKTIGSRAIDGIQDVHGIKSGSAREFVDNAIALNAMRPSTFFLRTVGYDETNPLYQLTFGTNDSLASGQRKMVSYKQRANAKYVERFVKDKKFVESIMGKKARDVKIKGFDTKTGKLIELDTTPDLLMALYMHAQNEQNLAHIVNTQKVQKKNGRIETTERIAGGMTVPNNKMYRGGKIDKSYEAGNATKIRMTPQLIQQALKQLTPKEMEFVRSAQKYYSEMSQPEVNAVSEKLLGYSLATLENYFRLNVDKRYRSTQMDSIAFDGSIENQGWTKERVDNTMPINLIALTQQLKKDIDGHSQYVGLAIPIRNFNKMYGVTRATYEHDENGNIVYDKKTGLPKISEMSADSVQAEIEAKWGGQSLEYIEKLLKDIQSPSDHHGFMDKIRSKYAASVLTLNAGVAVKQAASYTTAAAEIGWAPLIKAFGNVATKNNRLNMDTVYKYSPLMYLRTEGQGYQEIADMQRRNSSAVGRALNSKALNWIQDMDVMTVKKLWKAAEYYVRDNFNDLQVGSDAYYKKVGEVHSNIIEKTQPNYTALQRGQLLRSDNDIVRAVFGMFKTQPYQNFSILYEATGNLIAKSNAYKVNNTLENKAALKGAWKKFGRAWSSQVVSALIFAAMQFGWDWLRKRDDKYEDEEGNFSLEQSGKTILESMASNAFGMLPAGSFLYETVQKLVDSKARTYGLDASAATDILNDLQSAIFTLDKIWDEYWETTKDDVDEEGNVIKSAAEKEKDWEKWGRELFDVATAAAQAAGLPLDNIKKDLFAVAKNGFRAYGKIEQNDYLADYLATRLESGSGAKTEFLETLYHAYDSGNKENYQEIYDILKENPKMKDSTHEPEEYLTMKLDTHLKDKYKLHFKPLQAFEGGVSLDDVKTFDKALVQYDEPTDSGKYGSYKKEEIYNALESTKLPEDVKSKLWDCMGKGGNWEDVKQELAGNIAKAEAKEKVAESRATEWDQPTLTSAVTSSRIYELANSKQAEKVDGWINDYVSGKDASWITNAEKANVSIEDAILYKLALDVYDSGNSGTDMYDVWNALHKMNLTDSERQNIWKNIAGYNKESSLKYSEYYGSDKYEKDLKNRSTSKTPAPVVEQPKEEPKKEEPKNEGYVSLGSSWIAGIEYDNATGTLQVTTNRGYTYTHKCDYDTYQAFKNSSSPGSFYNSHFK